MSSKSSVQSPSRRGFFLIPGAAATVFLLTQNRTPKFKVREVELAEGKTMIDSGVLVLDVRQKDRFEHRHIVGAMPLPLSVLQAGIPEIIAYAKALPVLVYCGDGLTIGPEATHILNQAGFAGAVNLKAGIEGWASAGYPIKSAA
jgi:rhodanese-related sulfurtransferase